LMKCIKCRGKAHIKLPRHNARFCADHFVEYFHEQIQKAIKKNKMFTHQDNILVTVSGGKDSLVLWEALLKLGYQAEGLYLDLGIGDYSQKSKELCMYFAGKRSLTLHVVSISEWLDMGINGIAKKVRRPPCSSCGLIKRYLFNRFSVEQNYQVVATGHNLDDEAATLLGNLLHWQTGYLSRQSPVMPSNHSNMVKKVKPLYRLTEKETGAYAIIKGIDYILEECPLAVGASSIKFKKVLNDLEIQSPGTKQQLYFGFLKKGKKTFMEEDKVELKSCTRCKQPTTIDLCAFCQLSDRLSSS